MAPASERGLLIFVLLRWRHQVFEYKFWSYNGFIGYFDSIHLSTFYGMKSAPLFLFSMLVPEEPKKKHRSNRGLWVTSLWWNQTQFRLIWAEHWLLMRAAPTQSSRVAIRVAGMTTFCSSVVEYPSRNISRIVLHSFPCLTRNIAGISQSELRWHFIKACESLWIGRDKCAFVDATLPPQQPRNLKTDCSNNCVQTYHDH